MRHWIKFVIGWILCLVFRFLPFRPPNFEMNLATQMPFAKTLGPISGFIFGAVSMFFFDAATGMLGWWTLLTALTYGLIGALAPYALKKMDYVSFAIIGTILFDAVTGMSMGPLLFGQSLKDAFIGQVPFTAMHLLGNVIFALLVSPVIESWVTQNDKLVWPFKALGRADRRL